MLCDFIDFTVHFCLLMPDADVMHAICIHSPALLDLYMIIERLHGYSIAIVSPINHVDDIKMRT